VAPSDSHAGRWHALSQELRVLTLAVQRARSGQAAQESLGKRTVLPGANGMATPAGRVSCPAVKSRVNWSVANRPPVSRTRQALQ
jgi:hypothetical protein